MWDQLIGDGDPVEVVVLVEEICRCADRLDRPGWTGLDAIVNGRDRARLTVEVDDAGEVTVVVDKVYTEAGQQQSTFKALRAELRRARPVVALSRLVGVSRRRAREATGLVESRTSPLGLLGARSPRVETQP
ncbi:hypothetical protein [Salinispora tropica]|uniref:hypothetical protein n=1 Tax=Salinispora tropica TaxID=168695 RepID=UPI00048B43BB|nr:hypothetical protein [Salinispora tropica]